jgi:hypothetical protein
LNGYFAAAERLNNRSEFFAQLHARRYRFVAYFGRDAAKPYDDLHKIYADILVAVRMLLDTHRQRDMGIGSDSPLSARGSGARAFGCFGYESADTLARDLREHELPRPA